MDTFSRFSRSARAAALALGVGGLPTFAQAATPIGDHFSIGGFGTLGGVVTNTDATRFGRDRQTGGADKTPALDVDSNLGVQLDAKATNWLSGTVQVLSTKREDLGFKPRIEWAYVLLKPVDGVSIRGGRMATPTFLVSDSRNIGYANNWLRPPNEVYALNLFPNFDGGDISYRRAFGPAAITVTALAGKTQFRVNGLDADVSGVRGLNLQVETDWVTLRLGRVTGDVSVSSVGIVNDGYTFTGYGATFDRDNVFLQGEYVTRRSSGLPEVGSNGWYAMAGYRFGSVLPYAILGRTSPSNDSIFHLSETQRTVALGTRWDAFRSAALKFQIERIDTDGTGGTSFTTPRVPSPRPGPPVLPPVKSGVTAFSVALDFTF